MLFVMTREDLAKARHDQGSLYGPWRTRTSNLGIKSPLLYQLS
jgi:hypothetical protein